MNSKYSVWNLKTYDQNGNKIRIYSSIIVKAHPFTMQSLDINPNEIYKVIKIYKDKHNATRIKIRSTTRNNTAIVYPKDVVKVSKL